MVFLQNSEEAGRLTLSRQLLNIVSRPIVSVVLYDIYTPSAAIQCCALIVSFWTHTMIVPSRPPRIPRFCVFDFGHQRPGHVYGCIVELRLDFGVIHIPGSASVQSCVLIIHFEMHAMVKSNIRARAVLFESEAGGLTLIDSDSVERWLRCQSS